MGYLEGAKVLDLFSGTGSLGLEALSRGAEHTTFVDESKKSISILAENIGKLKVGKGEYTIVNADVLSFLQRPATGTFDLVLIDPPFTKKMAHEVMKALSSSSIFHEGTLIVIESLKQELMEDQYGGLHRYDMKDYGDKILSLFSVSGHKEGQ